MSELNQRQPLAMPWMVHRRAPVTHRRGMAATVLPGAVWLPAVWLVLVGSGLQGYANATLDAFFVGLLFLGAGLVAVRLLFRRAMAEQRVFLLTYGICIFVGGLAQCYSLATFGMPQSTIDSNVSFFPFISAQPPFTTLDDIPWNHNSRLAILIWQQVYKLAWWLHFDFGPYTGVMFNALVMGVTGSITVRAARELYGNDAWRLWRVSVLFAFCGLFILSGAILLRDCFTTLINALVLWSLIRYLLRPTWSRLATAAMITSVLAYAMSYLRMQSVPLLLLFVVLAVFIRSLTVRSGATRLGFTLFGLLMLLVASPYVLSYVQEISRIIDDAQTAYAPIAARASREDSLAMRFMIHGWLPVRMILGTGLLVLHAIPLWSYFRTGALDNGWIIGYHGFYQALTLPLVLAGAVIILRRFRTGCETIAPYLFLVAYLLLTVAAIVATTFEVRHVAQFLSAYVILAAIPDTRSGTSHKLVKAITVRWFTVVVLAHAAWWLRQIT